MRTEYEKEYWDKQAQLPNIEALLTEKATVTKVIKILIEDIKDTKVIVEVGSAIGRLTVPMSKKFPKAKVYGIDISGEMIKRAKKAKNVKYIQNNGTEINIKDIDFAYSVTLFQHLEEDELRNYLREVYKNLVNDGVFRFQFVEGEERSAFSQQYSETEIADLAVAEGFKVISCKQDIYPNWRFITLQK